jgi:16S rRNA (uracil1498-N3)-methyltransferase
MTRRFFVPSLPTGGGSLALPDDEALHAARVVRVSPGEQVTLFDGRGNEANGTVAAVQRRQVYVDFDDPQPVSREAECQLTLAVSLPKGDRARVLVEKLTELGVASLIPLTCERTQGKQTGLNMDKLQRYVVEASKQCGRNQLMKVCRAREFENIIAETSSDRIRWLAHPSGIAIKGAIDNANQHSGGTSQATILIGPEGGFTDREVDSASAHGWNIVALGARILRVETAAAAIVARLILQ